MTSAVTKFLIAAILTAMTAVALVGISGTIIFADVKHPSASSVVDRNVPQAARPLAINGGNR